MRRCTTISSLDEAESLSDAWLELADACGAGPFARPLFALTWWRHLGQGSLMVVAVHEDDQLVALAPLHQRRIGPVQVVRWLGHGLGTVAEALVRPGHDAAGDLLWSTAGARGRVLDLIECRDLGPLPGRRSAAPRYPVALQERDVCPVIDVHGDAEAHLADPACKRVRRTVRVARRRLTEAGHAFEVKVAHDTATLAALLPDARHAPVLLLLLLLLRDGRPRDGVQIRAVHGRRRVKLSSTTAAAAAAAARESLHDERWPALC